MTTEMIVAELIACGVSAKVVAAVSVALAASDRVEAIREQAAERQRRKRFRDRHATSRDALPPETPNQNKTPPEKAPPSSSPRGRKQRGTPLPEYWTPTEADRQYAQQKGLTEPEITATVERFTNFWRSKPGARREWAAAWRYHLDNYAPRRPRADADAPPAARRRGDGGGATRLAVAEMKRAGMIFGGAA